MPTISDAAPTRPTGADHPNRADHADRTVLADHADRAMNRAAVEPDARAFYAALNDLLRVVQFRDRDRACCYDVSVSQCYALKSVVEDGPVTVNELAAALYLDKSTASRIAGGLEAKGYVARERDPDDGRIVHLVATGSGRALCGRIDTDLTAEYAELLEDFDPAVRGEMIRLLGRLSRSFGQRIEVGGGSCCVVRPD